MKTPEEVFDLSWDELLAEAKPLDDALRIRIQELVKGVVVPVVWEDEFGSHVSRFFDSPPPGQCDGGCAPRACYCGEPDP